MQKEKFICLEVGLDSSPKIVKLSLKMGWTIEMTVARVFRLCSWVLEKYPDGDLRKCSGDKLVTGAGAGWIFPEHEQIGVQFMEALIFSDWIETEPHLRMKDWWKIGGPYLRSADRVVYSDILRIYGIKKDEPLILEKSTSPTVISFPVVSKRGQHEWGLTERVIHEFQAIYTGVDVLFECKKMLAWLKSNPTKLKTERGMPRFINSWLARAQNKGGYDGRRVGGSNAGYSKPQAQNYDKARE